MDNMDNSISVVIPVYNSADTLESLTTRLMNVLSLTSSKKHEIIFVNDGSHDRSWETICQLSQEFSVIRGINLMRNYGQHNALLCGVRCAEHEIIITMDDDLQHPPEEIPHLLKKLSEGYDVVYGSPKRMPHSLWRNISSRITKATLAFVMGIKTIREISAFRAFRTELRNAFVNFQSSGVILDVLLTWGTTRFTSIAVEEHRREIGHSNYTFLKLLGQVFLILTGYSTAPLRFASLLGFTLTIFGFGIFTYVVILYLTAGSIPGFPFLASIISIFSGTQLFTLGIIGEYLGRVFDRSMDRPSYVIGETTSKGS
jgi:glycosyltransferase involved in cell wall biosynthesis